MIACSTSMFGQNFVWTQTSAPNLNWEAITSSSDGTKLAAVVYGDYIYTSTNSGVTWTQQTNSGSRTWSCIASSADGTKLVAAVYYGGIYASTNSGATWTLSSAPIESWQAIASSSDGTKLVAVTYGGFNTSTNGGVYTSTDSGKSWKKTAAPTLYGTQGYIPNWQSVASSSDGSRLVAGVNGGFLCVSSDAGTTWTTTSAPNGSGAQWYSIASSSDGTKLVAVTLGLGIYASTDAGTNWTKTSAPSSFMSWVSVASSSDGNNLAAADANSGIYTSTNAGATWTHSKNSAPSQFWRSVTSSADGTQLAAAANDSGAGIFTGTLVFAPSITSQPHSLTVTNGHSATFNVGATGSLLAYQWIFNGTNLLGATNATLTMQNVFLANAGAYSVAVTNAYGSVTSNPAMLTVLPLGITAPTMLTSGQFQFSFDTATGVNYAVEYSTNLTQWFPFVTLGGIGVPLTLIDPNAAGSQQRFYRIVLTPQ